MKILHVEDTQKDFDFCEERLVELGNEVSHAKTNSEAKSLLQVHAFDYVMLDLAIPFDSPDGEPQVAHGIELAIHIRNTYPGIPLLVLTGQSSEPATLALEDFDNFTNFWDGKWKTLFKIRKKSKFDVAFQLVKDANELLLTLDNFELDLEDDFCRKLSLHEQRIIKLFAKKHEGATVAKVRKLGGGLSDATVLRVTLTNAMGHEIQSAVCKIGEIENAAVETANFNQHVVSLGVGSFPNWLGEFYAGCGNLSGVFFRLAENYSQTFFDVITESDERAAEVLTTLRGYETNWHANFKPASEATICEIRRSQLSDEKFANVKLEFSDIDFDAFESKTIQVRYSIQHGDHHGGNVLVSDANDPVVIDYGDIGEFCCSLDPVVLDLSCYFHPDSRDSFERTDAILENWFPDNLDDLLAVVAKPQSVKLLREWTDANAFSGREIKAITYAYCVRQISYDGTDKEFAISLIKKTMELLN